MSTELTVRGFIDQMYSLGYDISPYLLNGQLNFYTVHSKSRSQSPLSDPLSKLENASILYKNDVLIIDAFSAMAPADIDFTRIHKVLKFFKQVVSSGLTIIFSIEHEDIDQTLMIPFYSSCEILLSLEAKSTAMGFIINMNLIRFAGSENKTVNVFSFRVEPVIGLVPEITESA